MPFYRWWNSWISLAGSSAICLENDYVLLAQHTGKRKQALISWKCTLGKFSYWVVFHSFSSSCISPMLSINKAGISCFNEPQCQNSGRVLFSVCHHVTTGPEKEELFWNCCRFYIKLFWQKPNLLSNVAEWLDNCMSLRDRQN